MSNSKTGGLAYSIGRTPGATTVRDQFAMAALQGILAYPYRVGGDDIKKPNIVCALAFDYADAMLAERAK